MFGLAIWKTFFVGVGPFSMNKARINVLDSIT